jgi:hypothetical protein
VEISRLLCLILSLNFEPNRRIFAAYWNDAEVRTIFITLSYLNCEFSRSSHTDYFFFFSCHSHRRSTSTATLGTATSITPGQPTLAISKATLPSRHLALQSPQPTEHTSRRRLTPQSKVSTHTHHAPSTTSRAVSRTSSRTSTSSTSTRGR